MAVTFPDTCQGKIGSGIKTPAAYALKVTTKEHLEEAHRIRFQVFVDEQGFPIETEMDAIDGACTHWLLIPSPEFAAELGLEPVEAPSQSKTPLVVRNRAIGTIRLVPIASSSGTIDPERPSKVASLGRLCLSKEARGRGLAKILVDALHAEAKAMGFESIAVHSQMDRVDFYKRRGYVVDSEDPIIVDGVGHLHMSINL